MYALRRRRYERGQTVWDIGLESLRFDLTLSEAVAQAKPEHGDGVLFLNRDVRHRVLSAVLANAGLRRTLRLAPREVWQDTLKARATVVKHEQALTADRAAGTCTATAECWNPVPVTRAEFVQSNRREWPTARVGYELAQPFYDWDRAGHDRPGMRVNQIGYMVIGEHTHARVQLLVLREPPRRSEWPTPAEAALVVEIAPDRGALLFAWEVRRQTYLTAGAEEVWVIDVDGQRILRQRQGETPSEIQYQDPYQSVTWYDSASAAVAVPLAKILGRKPSQPAAHDVTDAIDFARLNATAIAHLDSYQTPWTIGHTSQWFCTGVTDQLGLYKDELWDGVLFGPEYQRDTLLSMILANVGLHDAVRLAPIELWQQALAEN